MILMVDDDLPLARLYCQMLTNNGFPASYVGTGSDALEFLASSPAPPSLIFVDIGLPDIHGVELVKRLRAAGYGDRPVVGFSSAMVLLHDDRIAPAEFVERWQKPLRLPDLVEIAKRWAVPATA